MSNGDGLNMKGKQFYLSEHARRAWADEARRMGTTASALSEAVAVELMGGEAVSLDESTRAIVRTALEVTARAESADRRERHG